MNNSTKKNNQGKILTTPQSLNGAIKNICDIMRRSNCAGALQFQNPKLVRGWKRRELQDGALGAFFGFVNGELISLLLVNWNLLPLPLLYLTRFLSVIGKTITTCCWL
ncbi:MAG: hypothetical protein HY314_06275 [Acidobacteria bacterium]|nr:hypothetical protein [Acidobacteriota bacterium]